MTQLIDYSYARPSPASIKGAGYAGVVRYLSPTSGKNLGAAERDGLLAAGLSIALVWESDGVTTGGPGVGASHARTANAQANALGYPAGCPIFYATDHDYTAAAVAGYYQGVASAGGRPWGIYGGIKVIDGINAPYYWQTGAWSSGRVSARAHLYQRIGGATISGTDVNDVRLALPLWSTSFGSAGGIVSGTVHIPGAPVFPTQSAPPAPTIAPSEEDMITLILWCYTELVGRTSPPNVTEIEGWISSTPGWTAAQVLDGFLNAVVEPGGVVKAYADFLGRQPSSGDIDLRKGMTIRQVRLDVASAAAAGKH